jgi:hypothetical protein
VLVAGLALLLLGCAGPDEPQPLVSYETTLRRDGAEFPFLVPEGAAALEVSVALPPGMSGGAEIGPLVPVGSLRGAWWIDPDRLLRLSCGEGAAPSERVTPVSPGPWLLRVEPIPMAMGESSMPRVRVRVRVVGP